MNLIKKAKSIQGNMIEVFKTSNWQDYYTPKATSDGCHIVVDTELPDDMLNIELFLPVKKDLPIGRVFVVTADRPYSSGYSLPPEIHIHQKVSGITQYVLGSNDPMRVSNDRTQMAFIWMGIYAGWRPITPITEYVLNEDYKNGSWTEGNGSGYFVNILKSVLHSRKAM